MDYIPLPQPCNTNYFNNHFPLTPNPPPRIKLSQAVGFWLRSCFELTESQNYRSISNQYLNDKTINI